MDYKIKEDNYYQMRPNKIRLQVVLDLIGGAPQKILDVGCYDGSIGRCFMSKGHDVTGIDSSSVIEKAGFPTIAADISKGFPVKSEMFDLVFAGEVIEHLYDTEFFLKEIARVLKPRGRLVVTTPNVASLGRRILLLFGRNPYLETVSDENNAGHIRYFTKDSLRALLAHCGFDVSAVRSDVVNFTDSFC